MNTIEMPSKLNYQKHLKDALRALERIPTHLQTVAILGAIKDLDDTLSNMEPGNLKPETRARILVLNTETGSSEVLFNELEADCKKRFEILKVDMALTEEPSKFKVMLQVSLIPDHWHTAHQLFAKSWS